MMGVRAIPASTTSHPVERMPEINASLSSLPWGLTSYPTTTFFPPALRIIVPYAFPTSRTASGVSVMPGKGPYHFSYLAISSGENEIPAIPRISYSRNIDEASCILHHYILECPHAKLRMDTPPEPRA